MNRRDFVKTAAAVAMTTTIAPAILVRGAEVYPDSNCPITLKMLQDAYGRAMFYGPHPDLLILEAL